MSKGELHFLDKKNVETVCNENITSTMLETIKRKLIGQGYMDLENKKPLRFNLAKYQKDKNLPIGQLDLETMKALNMEIE